MAERLSPTMLRTLKSLLAGGHIEVFKGRYDGRETTSAFVRNNNRRTEARLRTSTFSALSGKGLIEPEYGFFGHSFWIITPAGRAALEQHEK